MDTGQGQKAEESYGRERGTGNLPLQLRASQRVKLSKCDELEAYAVLQGHSPLPPLRSEMLRSTVTISLVTSEIFPSPDPHMLLHMLSS